MKTKDEGVEAATAEGPKDTYKVVYVFFFFLGLVHLLPWNFFHTDTNYWMYKFRNTSIDYDDANSEDRSTLQANFNAALLIVLEVTAVTFLIIALLWGSLISLNVRFRGMVAIVFVLFVILTALVKIDTDTWQKGFFGLVLLIAAIINSMTAVFTVTLYTAAACFPHHYLASYLTGSSLVEVFTAALVIISLASGISVLDSGLIYFSTGTFVIGFTLIYIIYVTGWNKFYLHHIKQFEQMQEKNNRHVGLKEGFRLFKKIWSCVAIMGLCLFQTNAAPVTLVVSEGEGQGAWNDVYFVPVVTFLLKALGDIAGRLICFRYIPKVPQYVFVALTVVRTAALVPFFMLCNAQPRHHLPVVLPHDYQYIILTVVSSISGGYLLSISSYGIARLVEKEELKDAYYVNMLLTGLIMGVLSFVSVVSVDLL